MNILIPEVQIPGINQDFTLPVTPHSQDQSRFTHGVIMPVEAEHQLVLLVGAVRQQPLQVPRTLPLEEVHHPHQLAGVAGQHQVAVDVHDVIGQRAIVVRLKGDIVYSSGSLWFG